MTKGGVQAIVDTLLSRKTAAAGALGAGAVLGGAEDAEGASRSDLVQKIMETLMGGRKGRVWGGTVEKQAQDDLKALNSLYANPKVILSEHAITSRFEKSGWSPEKIAEYYARLLDDEGTRGIPNFVGRQGSEALWLDDGVKSIMSPVLPYKDGALALTMVDPETEKVLRHLESVGWKSGERSNVSPSEYTPNRIGNREGSLRSGSDKFSAVDNQPETLSEAQNSTKGKTVKSLLPLASTGTAAITASLLGTPEDAEAVPYKQWSKALFRQFNEGKGFENIPIGSLSSKAKGKARSLGFNPSNDDVMLKKNIAEKIYDKHIKSGEMSPQEAVEWINSLVHGNKTRFIPHEKEDRLGMVRYVDDNDWRYGALAPQGREFDNELITAFPAGDNYIKNQYKKAACAGGTPSPSCSTSELLPSLAQRERFSAVNANDFSGLDDSAKGKNVKSLIPFAGAGTAAIVEALTGDTQAQAGLPQQSPMGWEELLAAGMVTADKPLESPLLDPIDALTAGVGIAGTLPRLAAVALEPPLTLGADFMLQGTGKALDEYGRQLPKRDWKNNTWF